MTKNISLCFFTSSSRLHSCAHSNTSQTQTFAQGERERKKTVTTLNMHYYVALWYQNSTQWQWRQLWITGNDTKTSNSCSSSFHTPTWHQQSMKLNFSEENQRKLSRGQKKWRWRMKGPNRPDQQSEFLFFRLVICRRRRQCRMLLLILFYF